MWQSYGIWYDNNLTLNLILDGRECGVWGFTFRDSPADYINVTVWGSPTYVANLGNMYSVGDVSTYQFQGKFYLILYIWIFFTCSKLACLLMKTNLMYYHLLNELLLSVKRKKSCSLIYVWRKFKKKLWVAIIPMNIPFT